MGDGISQAILPGLQETNALVVKLRPAFETVGEVRRYLPQLAGMQLVADTGATIGWLAPAMDDALGGIRRRKERLV